MSEKFSVSMESPQSGWMSLRLRAGAREFVAVVSHQPYDSLRELIEALVSLLGGARAATVRWNAEPEEYDFVLKAEGEDRVSLRVVHHQGHRREASRARAVFTCRASRVELCLPFWRELSEMSERSETDVFEQNWRRKFPRRELRRLTDAFKTHAPEVLTPARKS
ncbi:MAG TPA: hypothetical protein VFS10_17015 [Pyrinomonadaceae bacterium]|nr:hypothetical protein [Pyrinomonadaceae bacterium]